MRGSGGVTIRHVTYQIGRGHAGQHVLVIADDTTISFFDTRTGELLIEHPLPSPGTRYISNQNPHKPTREHHNVTEVLRHQTSPKS